MIDFTILYIICVVDEQGQSAANPIWVFLWAYPIKFGRISRNPQKWTPGFLHREFSVGGHLSGQNAWVMFKWNIFTLVAGDALKVLSHAERHAVFLWASWQIGFAPEQGKLTQNPMVDQFNGCFAFFEFHTPFLDKSQSELPAYPPRCPRRKPRGRRPGRPKMGGWEMAREGGSKRLWINTYEGFHKWGYPNGWKV